MKYGPLAARMVIGFTLFGAPSLARAEATEAPRVPADSGVDLVVLKDGSSYRGALTEVVKNDHVTLLLGTGQSARIRWDAIARMERKEQSPTEEAAPPPIAVSAGTEKVFVHIDASRTVDLEHYEGGGAQPGNWVRVCSSPCDREVAAGTDYRIAGDGISGSKVFALEGARVTLTADVATKAKFKTGFVLEIVAASALVTGAAFTAAGTPGPKGSYYGGSEELRVAGVISMGVGLLAAVPGFVLLLGNTSSSVDITTSPKKDALQREPTWDRPQLASCPPLTFSIFRGTF